MTEAIWSSGIGEGIGMGIAPTSQGQAACPAYQSPHNRRLTTLLLTVRLYEKVSPFPAYSNKARKDPLARPCTGRCALAADCKFPSRPIRRQ